MARRYWYLLLLIAITFFYLVAGIVLAVTSSEWKAADSFAMAGTIVFFGIGAGLAVAHIQELGRQKDIMKLVRQKVEIVEQILEKQDFRDRWFPPRPASPWTPDDGVRRWTPNLPRRPDPQPTPWRAPAAPG